MDASLNLTPARGPSVWDKPQPTVDPWRVAAITTGLVLMGAGWPYRSRAGQVRTGLGLLALALGMRCEGRIPSAVVSMKQWMNQDRHVEAQVDRTLEESFPASDPPAH
jgi:hypothetical protein